MAEKTPSSRIRYDDIVNAIYADPAKAEPVIALAGYVGRSSEKGNVRLYPDASLCYWYEVAEADIVHSRPIDDSPLGGSHVWVKASANLTPSIPIPPPAPAAEGDGKADAKAEGADAAAAGPAVGGDTGVFNPMATIHPTLWTQLCPTHIGCPPGGGGPGTIHPTIWTQLCPTGVGCIATVACLPPGGLRAAAMVGPTGTQGCTQPGHCVGQTGWHTCACPAEAAIGTAATICTHGLGCPSTVSCPPTNQVVNCATLQGDCQVATAICPTQGCPTQSPVLCQPSLVAICPVTSPANCQLATAHCGPVTINPTASTRCFICPPLTSPPQCIVQNPTASTRCFICPPITRPPQCIDQQLPPTRAITCLRTAALPCPMTWQGSPCAGPTAGFGCPSTSTCPPQGLHAEAAAMVGPTGTQGCTQPGHCVGQTGWHTCACPIGPTGTEGCTQALGCPNTSTCPPLAMTDGMTVGCDVAAQQSTAATLCTRYHCPIGPTGWHTCACPIGPTGWHTCGCPVITLLTVNGCHPTMSPVACMPTLPQYCVPITLPNVC
jgi:hypothetical protein